MRDDLGLAITDLDDAQHSPSLSQCTIGPLGMDGKPVPEDSWFNLPTHALPTTVYWTFNVKPLTKRTATSSQLRDASDGKEMPELVSLGSDSDDDVLVYTPAAPPIPITSTSASVGRPSRLPPLAPPRQLVTAPLDAFTTVVSPPTRGTHVYVFDTGSKETLTSVREHLTNHRLLVHPVPIAGAFGGNRGAAIGVGDLELSFTLINGTTSLFIVKDVYHVPKLRANLLSG